MLAPMSTILPAHEGAALETREERSSSWSRLDWIAVSIIALVGGAVRLVNVGFPPKIMFDETYYAKDACLYAKGAAKVCGIDAEQTGVHPPLGKWLISLGIKTFGYDSFGWRIAAVVAGTITIALLYVLARKILRSTLGAVIAASLLAMDFLHFVQSRIAMLDVFVPLFGIASLLFLVFDRDRMATGEPQCNGFLHRPWRLAAGLAAGAATASKWSGIFYLALVIVLTVVWEVQAGRDASVRRPFAAALRQEALSIVLLLLLAPVALYTLTYVGRLEGAVLAAPASENSWAHALWQKQFDAWDFHQDLVATHSYQSPTWSWLLLKRPVSYYYCSSSSEESVCNPTPEGQVQEIFAAGSPFVWWTSILALGWAAWSWIRTRNYLAPTGFILAGFAFGYLPWLWFATGRPAVFIFYLLPVIPFMCLALAWTALRLGDSWEARGALALFSAGAIGLFAFYYPLLAGSTIPQESWNARIWIFKGSQCDKPEGTPETSTVTTTAKGTPETSETIITDNSDLPPKGWCWI